MRDAVRDGWRGEGAALEAAECLGAVDFLIGMCRNYGVPLDLRLLFDGVLPDLAAGKAGEHEVDWRDHAGTAVRERVTRLQYSGPPKTRAERVAMDAKIAERIHAAYDTRSEQVEAWVRETGRSERAFDRRSADLRIAE